ncbi:MAG TPA: hypothetical protein VGQ83_02025 [Polyangia bacterium]|jgi:hypothetical protein
MPGSAIAALALVVCAGGCRPQLDLRQECVLVAGDAFWRGCDADCREEVTRALENGAQAWFRHFPEARRPRVRLVAEAPPTDDNVIHLEITPDLERPAVYSWGLSAAIHFRSHADVTPLIVAHELGHALWGDGHVAGRLSVMSATELFYVTPDDLALVCAAHAEVPCPPHRWCEGTFVDRWRCPSGSPDEGERRLEAARAP